MTNHPNRSKPKRCIFCDEGWTVCYDKHDNRYHVALNIRSVEPCRAIKKRTFEESNK